MPSTYSNNSLVFRFDDQQQGCSRVVAINSEKCLIGFPAESWAKAKNCAIIRGSQGTALRSLSDEIAVNGVPSTCHWIQPGDRIEFTDSISAVVEQLGQLQQELSQLDAPAPTLGTTELEPSPVSEAPLVSETPSVSESLTGLTFDALAQLEPATDEPQGAPAGFTESTRPAETIQSLAPDSLEPSLQSEPAPTAASEGPADTFAPEATETPASSTADLQAEIRSEIASVFASLTGDTDAGVEEKIVGFQPEEVSEEPAESVQATVIEEPTPTWAEPPAQTVSESATPEFTESIAEQPLATEPHLTTESNEAVDPAVAPHSDICAQLGLSDLLNTTPQPTTQELEQPAQASEPVGESIECLTRSQLTDGSSHADPMASTVEEPELRAKTDSVSLLKELLATPCPGESPDAAVESTSGAEPAPAEDSAFASSVETPVETPVETEETSSEQAPTGNESVSELLERMKREGQWDGVDDDDDAPFTEPEPVRSNPIPEPVVEAPAEVQSENVEDDVNSYMSNLLSRMRGGQADAPASPAPVVSKPEPTTPKSTQQSQPEVEPPVNPLTPEEFIPKQKAKPIQSLDAMRELANTTARTAVNKCENERRKALGSIQIAIGVTSFVMSLYYLLWESSKNGDIQFFVGMVCLIIAGFLAFRYYQTMVHNEMVATQESLEKKKKQQGAGTPDQETQPEVLAQLVAPVAPQAPASPPQA